MLRTTFLPVGSVPVLTPTGYSLYVNPATGDDANPGTLALPLETITRALQLLAQRVFWEAPPTIVLADGDYSAEGGGQIAMGWITPPATDDGSYLGPAFYMVGDTVTPANVILPYLTLHGTRCLISGVDATNGLDLYSGAVASVASSRLNYLYVADSQADTLAGVTFLGAAAAAFDMAGKSTVNVINTVTVSGTPAYSAGFAQLLGAAATLNFAAQPTGSATGKRYSIVGTGQITGTGADANYLPGDAAGTIVSTQYV